MYFNYVESDNSKEFPKGSIWKMDVINRIDYVFVTGVYENTGVISFYVLNDRPEISRACSLTTARVMWQRVS